MTEIWIDNRIRTRLFWVYAKWTKSYRMSDALNTHHVLMPDAVMNETIWITYLHKIRQLVIYCSNGTNSIQFVDWIHSECVIWHLMKNHNAWFGVRKFPHTGEHWRQAETELFIGSLTWTLFFWTKWSLFVHIIFGLRLNCYFWINFLLNSTRPLFHKWNIHGLLWRDGKVF